METDTARVLGRFLTAGQVQRMPSKAAKRLVVLEHLAGRFEPGKRYAEKQVDATLIEALVPREDGGEVDHVSVRRYLVDHGLMSRADGVYWRR